jgi:hypothetical protein
MPSPDPQNCPLCGKANQCAQAAPASRDQPCWCFSAKIGPEALERIPPEERGCSCICLECASGATPAARRND